MVFLKKWRAALAALAVVACASSAQAQSAKYCADSLAAYNAVLATVKPGQTRVYAGDEGFNVADLKEWRDELLAHIKSGRSGSGAFDWTVNKTWPNKRIPYFFDTTMDDSHKTMFRNAIFEWQKKSNIRWEARKSTDTDYVRVVYQDSGMDSFLGRVGGEQILHVDASANLIRCAHEIGHAAGLIHEQCRSDRETYVSVVSTKKGVDALKSIDYALAKGSKNYLRSAYDYDSLMHYPASSCNGNSATSACATITPKEPYYTNAGKPTLGQEDHISVGDAQAMSFDYGAPCSISGRVTSGSVGVPNITVTCTGKSGSTYFGPSVTTDSNGNYTLPGVVTGTYTVTVSGGGTFTQNSQSATVATTPVSNINFQQVDTTGPQITVITAPVNETSYRTLTALTGTATDNTGVDYVVVVLQDLTTGKWWNWSAKTWGTTTFDGVANVKKVDNASNSTTFNFSAGLPALADGHYNVQVKGVDTHGTDNAYIGRNYKLDATGPVVTITHPENGEALKAPASGSKPAGRSVSDTFDGTEFSRIEGSAFDATGIQNNQIIFTLYQNGDFWTGTAWKSNTNAQDNAVKLKANVNSGGGWTYTSVPSGGNLRNGAYYVSATATDTLGNIAAALPKFNQNNFTVDTSAPTATITNPAPGSTIITAQSGNWITGTATDPPGAASKVKLFLIRANGAGTADDEYWDGTAWAGGGSAILPTSLVGTNWTNSGPLPTFSGTNNKTRFTPGAYILLAIAYDAANNKKQVESDFSVDFHQTYTYTAGSYSDTNPNNDNELWSNAANWSPKGVPTSDSIAVIPGGNPDNTALGSVSIYGLNMTGGTLHTNGMSIRKLNISGGYLLGGAITINANAGVWNWTGGRADGTITIPVGATLNMGGDAVKEFGPGSTIKNQGAVSLGGTSSFQGDGSCTFNNESGATFAFTSPDAHFGQYNGDNVFNNKVGAKFVRSGEGGVATFDTWTLNNAGDIRNLLADSPTDVLAFNATVNLNEGSVIAGIGRTQLTGGVFNIVGATTVSGVNFQQIGGAIDGTGLLTTANGGTYNWAAGRITKLKIAASGNMKISGDSVKEITAGGVLTNFGTTLWYGTGAIQADGGATWNNESGATFSVSDDAGMTIYNGDNTFNNKAGAKFLKSDGTDNTTCQWAFNNNGTTRVLKGRLTLYAGGQSSGTFNTDAGAVLAFAGGDSSLQSGAKFIGAGKAQLTGGTLSVATTATAGDTTTPGVFEVTGGHLAGPGALTANGVFNWSGGAISKLDLAASGKLSLVGEATKEFVAGGIINNSGVTTWSGAGAFQADGGCIWNNKTGATFVAASDAAFTIYNGDNVFNNASGAKFQKTVGAGDPTQTNCGWAFNNEGILRSQAGIVSLNAGGQSGGTFTADSGAIVRFAGGGHTLKESARCLGMGKTQLTGGNLSVATTATAGDATTPGVFEVSGGALDGPGVLTANGVFNWTAGRVTNLQIASTGKFYLSGDAVKEITAGGILSNAGAATWSGTGSIQADGGATFNNESGATFSVATDADMTIYNGDNVFNNKAGAKVFKTVGAGGEEQSTCQWAFNNNGTLRGQAGIVSLYAGGQSSGIYTADSGAIVRFADGVHSLATGAKLLGAGKIQLSGGVVSVLDTATGGDAINPGLVEVNGGVLDGPGVFVETGVLKWTSGRITNLNLAPGAFLNLMGAAVKEITAGGVINNAGTVTLSDVGALQADGGCTWNNQGTGVFNIATDGAPFTIYNSDNVFNNQPGAILAKTAGSGTTTLSNWTFNNLGDTSGASGTLRTNLGTMEVATTLNLKASTTLKGTGAVLWNGIINADGTITAQGPVEFRSGNLNPLTPATGPAPVSFSGTLDWTGGLLTGTLALTNGSTLKMSGEGTKELAAGGILNNAGTVIWSGGNFQGDGSTTFNNLAGATFLAKSAGRMTIYNGDEHLNNNGTLQIGGPLGILGMDWDFAQGSTGVLEVDLGGTNATTPKFDQLQTTGAVTLAGTLKVALANGFSPATNQTFKIITGNSVTGQFATLTKPAGVRLNALYNADNVTLSVPASKLETSSARAQ